MENQVSESKMRTPEVYYFERGYVKFKKIDGDLHYQIWKYEPNGMMSMIVDNGKVKDEDHLKQLLAIQDLGVEKQ